MKNERGYSYGSRKNREIERGNGARKEVEREADGDRDGGRRW